MRRSVLAIAAVVALVGCGGDPAVTDPDQVGQIEDMARASLPTGKKIGTILTATQNRTKSKITYHNGPVMAGTSTVYLIWYGNWSGSTAPAIIGDLVGSLGGSPYFLIN